VTEILTRAAAGLSSLDEATREVDAVLATETPCRRRDWENGGHYDEVLICTADAIDTTRLDSLACLDGHKSSSVENRLGTVVPGSLRFENGAAIVRIKLSRNAKADAVLADLADSHTLNTSLGYRILSAERIETDDGEAPTLRCTTWEPLELSVVQIPFDPNAKTRNFEGNTMTTKTKTRSAADTATINELASHFGEAEFARSFIDDGKSVAEFRTALLERMAENEPVIDGNFGAPGLTDRHANHMTARAEALAARLTGATPQGDARHFATSSLMDHARGIVEATGTDTRSLSRDEIIGRAMSVRSGGMHTTSDFIGLLQGAGRRVLMQGYEAAQSPLKTRLSRSATMSDFRAKSMLKISDGGLLQKVNEHGEIKSTTRAESAEGYKLETYASMFSMSRQAIINDDLGAFADWNSMAGRMSALTENKLLFDLLTQSSGSGPVMGEDSVRMFHSDHGNLGTPAALSVDSLSAARTAMRKQTGFDGVTRINVQPAVLLVGPELETTAEKILATLNANTVAEQNPFGGGKLELAVESQMDGIGWYVFANPASVPVLEWAYLSGAPGPSVAVKDSWEILGSSFRVSLDFGAGACDFRGVFRNEGAEPEA